MKYTPDQKCGTCRNLTSAVVGDGYHEPRYVETDCGVTDQLVKLEGLMREIADEHGDEDAYGEHPTEEMGSTKLCPFYLPWGNCATHDMPEPPGDLCPLCEEEAVEQMMAAEVEATTLTRQLPEEGS